MSDWVQEVRYAARVLLKSPGFTILAVLSLALGIGVNTAVLAVGRAVLLAPLPVSEPDQLAIAYWWRGDKVSSATMIASGRATDQRTGRSLSSNYDYRTYTALREAVRDQADLFAFTLLRQANVSLGGQAATGGGMLVSGNYFSALRVPMHLGRGVDERDDRVGAESVVVLAHGMWRRAFAGDPAIVGKTVRVNGRPFTVIGVTTPAYYGVSDGGFFPPADITLPLSAQPLVSPQWTRMAAESGASALFETDQVLWLRIMARVKPGVSRTALESALSVAFHQRLNETSKPVPAGAEAPAIVLLDGARGLESMRSALETPLMLLGAVAALVFLIACVNVASLVIVRGVGRQQEFWIRLALGAGRGRLIRQTIVESLLLALGGGLLGALLAVWAGRLIVSTLAGSWPTALAIDLDPSLIALASGVSFLAALLFGLLPGVRLASRSSAEYLRQSGAGAAAPRLGAGRTLVLVQVAIAVPLVVGAGLFLRTIHNLASVELGFEPRGLVIFKMDPSLNGYEEARTKGLYARVIERLEAAPGIRGATVVENALVSGWTSGTNFSLDGGKPESMLMNRVGPGFFETVGLPLSAGRGIGVQDAAGAPPVGVVNEAAVRTFFKGQNPIGRHVVTSGRNRMSIEIVGIARDAKYNSLKQNTRPTIYLPYFQSSGLGAMHVMVKADAERQVLQSVRAAVAEVAPDVPVSGVKTQQQTIDETIGNERAITMLLVFFGMFALLLACIGLHGVTAYTVAQRTGEIGIRLALGAQRSSILWLVLRQVVVLACGGLLIGIPAAAVGSRTVRAHLFGVQPTDPWSIGIGASVLFVVAVFAGFIPARRAARLDPLVALRRD